MAIAFRNYATAATLIGLGVDTEAKDIHGRKQLHVAGLDARAKKKVPSVALSHLMQVVAFQNKAPSPRIIAPFSDASLQDTNADCATADLVRETAPIVDIFLNRGFDFCSPHKSGNLPFSFADDDSMHYSMVLAAACQGLFG